MLVTKKMLNAAKIASPDETRPCLAGLRFEPENNRVVATDGHRLIVVDRLNCEDKDFPTPEGIEIESSESFTLPAKVCLEKAKDVKKVTAKNGPFADLCQVGKNGDGKHKLVTTIAGNQSVSESKAVDGKFPNYGQVVPDVDAEDSGYSAIGLSVNLLRGLLESMEGNGTGGLIKFYTKDKDHPIVIKSEEDDHNITAMLMPMRF